MFTNITEYTEFAKSILLAIAAIITTWTVIGEKWRSILLSPFIKKKEIAETEAATSSANISSKEQVYELVNTLETRINELHSKVLMLQDEVIRLNDEKGQAITESSSHMSKIKTLFNKMITLCETMCGEKEKCKEQVYILKKEFTFLENETQNERIN